MLKVDRKYQKTRRKRWYQDGLSDGTSTKRIKDVSEPILRNELILKLTFLSQNGTSWNGNKNKTFNPSETETNSKPEGIVKSLTLISKAQFEPGC